MRIPFHRPYVALRRLPWEALVWAGALAALAVMDPHAEPLVDLCVLKALGATFCPGCGLGQGVSLLLHGAVMEAVQVHPLAPVAVGVLTHRILTLVQGSWLPAPSS